MRPGRKSSRLVTIPFSDNAEFFVSMRRHGRMVAGMRVGEAKVSVVLPAATMKAKLRGMAMKLAGRFVDELIGKIVLGDLRDGDES